PEGEATLNGTAKFDANGGYTIASDIVARDVSFLENGQRIRNINLKSAASMDPHQLRLRGLRVTAPGSELTADASLEDFARFTLTGALRRLDLRTVASIVGDKSFPYDGVVSGPLEASGDLSKPGMKGLLAQARLAIAAGPRGIPVSGRIVAAYNGATQDINVGDSYIALPHTRVTLRGSVGKRLDLELVTRDLGELLAAAPKPSPPLALNNGQATVGASVAGSLATPRITAHLAAERLSVAGRQFDQFSADVAASPSRAAVSNGAVTRGAMRASFAASIGLKDWSVTPNQPVAADAGVQNGDLADILALAGQPSQDFSGALSVTAHASGTLGNPIGAANLSVTNGSIQGEAFDRIEARLNLSDRLISLPQFRISSGSSQVELSAEMQHPRDSFSTGSIHAHVRSTPVDLAQFQTALKQYSGLRGQLQVDADIRGDLSETAAGGTSKPKFLPAVISADVSA